MSKTIKNHEELVAMTEGTANDTVNQFAARLKRKDDRTAESDFVKDVALKLQSFYAAGLNDRNLK